MDQPNAWNVDFIEAQYTLWKKDPETVSRQWRSFFEGFEMGASGKLALGRTCDENHALRQSRVEALKHRYRDVGHLLACLDPLQACPTDHPLLNLKAFNLTLEDLNETFFTRRFSKTQQAPLKEIVNILKETYCRAVGVEYMHLQDPAERRWLQDRMEPIRNHPKFDRTARIRILQLLFQAELFENFLNKKYLGQTRFSLEGAETVIPMLHGLANQAAGLGCREIILGMAHRGRLNVQTNFLNKPYEMVFNEFENTYDPESVSGSGDVKYHRGYFTKIDTTAGKPLQLVLVSNPSHLESVNPVVEGIARARQDTGLDPKQVLPLLLHGDAAFSGQGVVAETLNMSQLKGYHTGGTIHLVINNQIGYTTVPENARSTRYTTDVAKMLMIPVFHVHGENPEAAVHVIQLACAYRAEFAKDVVIDVVCYRRYGHNEGDEPYFTQPGMYNRINQRPSVSRMYGQTLMEAGHIQAETIEEMQQAINHRLAEAYQTAKEKTAPVPNPAFYDEWQPYYRIYSHAPVKTGVPRKRLLELAGKLTTPPDGFSLHPKLQNLLDRRKKAVAKDTGIDWANAELLAFGSLLQEGKPIRFSGQDCLRGTFSQRHAAWVDTRTDQTYVPLNHVAQGQAPFLAYDSLLSEAGVLGFEYGYSQVQPEGLVLWEAQFGDFVNNAQAVIDLYIAAGESKWQRPSGLVMLLPHGYEGMGPEHSSARPERFLQLCAGDNLQVCNPTTPAQYFHLLRRQAHCTYRRPLIVLTPKSLLRHPLAVSVKSDLADGFFNPVLDDPAAGASPSRVARVLLCSGKIYYELSQKQKTLKPDGCAIVRLEQYYPFPEKQLVEIFARYQQAKQWYWIQEEPKNMGPWQFIRPRMENIISSPLRYIGRPAASSPATGYPNIHKQEQAEIMEAAFMDL